MLSQINRLLRARGVTHEKLARAVASSRAHVCLVLANKPGRGGHTRKKLARLLTLGELDALGWDTHGNLDPMACSTGNNATCNITTTAMG